MMSAFGVVEYKLTVEGEETIRTKSGQHNSVLKSQGGRSCPWENVSNVESKKTNHK